MAGSLSDTPCLTSEPYISRTSTRLSSLRTSYAGFLQRREGALQFITLFVPSKVVRYLSEGRAFRHSSQHTHNSVRGCIRERSTKAIVNTVLTIAPHFKGSTQVRNVHIIT